MAQAFQLIAAVDLLGGTCVRLHQGDYEKVTTYSREPREMARRWFDDGAPYLHVVDLDAAKAGRAVNRDAILSIVECAREFNAKIEVGGGVRSLDDIEQILGAGVDRVVLGTVSRDIHFMESAVKRFGGDHLVAGLDGRDGKLAVNGWTEQTDISLVGLARELVKLGVKTALVTDVSRDGAMTGPNLELACLVSDTGLDVILSGGIRDLNDVLEAESAGLYGAVVGKSIYDGTLDLREAYRRIREGDMRC